MVIHYNLLIRGQVQGVAYRASAVDMAMRLGITGYIKNNSDGTVSCEVEGEENLMYKFVQWCHHGPVRAVVEHVSITGGEIKGYTSFEMRQ